MQCLNLKNKEVKAALDEVTAALGSEDAAYYVISENNGYPLDLAPDGALSKLFSDLLGYFDGDRVKTIQEKAKTYSKSFKEYYGDWTISEIEPNVIFDNGIHYQRLNNVADATYFESIFGDITDAKSGYVVDKLSQYIPANSNLQKYINLFKNSDIDVLFVSDSNPEYTGSYMFYVSADNKIYINVDAFNDSDLEYNATSILHEMVHAFTVKSMISTKYGDKVPAVAKNAYDAISKLYDYYLSQHPNIAKSYDSDKFAYTAASGKYYYLRDKYEFVAEMLTDSEAFSSMIDDALSLNNDLLRYVKKAINAIIELVNEKLGPNIKSFSSIEELNSAKLLVEDLILYNMQEFNTNTVISELDFNHGTKNNAEAIKRYMQEFDRYNFNSKEELDRRLSDIRENLLNSLTSRYKAIDDSDKVRRTELRQAIEYQIKNLQNELVDDITNIQMFIDQLRIDVRDVAQEVLDAYNGRTNALSDERLISLDRNYFGFYCKAADEIYNSLANIGDYREYIGVKLYDELMSSLLICKTLLDASSDHVKRMLVENATRLIKQTGMSVNSPTIYQYLQDNKYRTGNEISFFTRWFGAGDKINDEAIKSMYKIVLDCEDIVNHNTFTKAKQLLNLLKKANNNQKALFELDENGKTTGYIVRERNYGKFLKDYKSLLQKIRAELGISSNDLLSSQNRDIRVEYNRRKNEWLSQHCERKYTAEYYDLFNHLSDEASLAREVVMIKIRDITNKYRDLDGIVHYEKMTNEEFDKLLSYYLEKKLLSSIYDIYGIEKPEGSIERQIADELSELNKKMASGLEMKVNHEKWEKTKSIKKQQLTDEEYKNWYNRNTRILYSLEWYDLLSKVERTLYGEQYELLNKQKREILNMFRDDKTGEININAIPNSTVNTINKIDTLLRSLRKKEKNSKVSTKLGLKFQDIAMIVPTEQFNRDYRAALEASQDDPGLLEYFLLRHTNRDSLGTVYPKSYYSKIVPRDSKYVSEVPSMNFSEISEDSPFRNSKYDNRNSEEYYQPKVKLYDNSVAYNKVMNNPELKLLRLALIDAMSESNAKMENMHNLNKYKLPLISGSTYKFFKAHGILGVWDKLIDSISVKGDDVGINKKPVQAPDGSSLAMIPLYFVKDLENPATISADMVGSILKYYRMAENYKLKSAIRPKVEIIRSFLALRDYTGVQSDSKLLKLNSFLRLKKDPKKGIDTNIYKFAKKFIDMNIYDVKTNSLTLNIGKREINVTKLLQLLKNFGTLRNLGLNFACAFTGFFTALHSHLMNTIAGRYYDFHDASYAFKDIVFDLLRHGISAGRNNYSSMLMALMDYFEVGSSIDSILLDTNRLNLVRVASKEWAFGIYSMSDYIIKGCILNSVMYNYRNVNGEFISKEDYYNKYGKTDITLHKWNSYKTAKGSIEYINGKIQVKNKADKEAWDKAKFTIGRTALNLAASADGMLTPLQKALFTTNVFGSLCMMHRQYIPIILLEKWTMSKQWDYTSLRWIEGAALTPLRVFNEIWKDKHNTNVILGIFNRLFKNKNLDVLDKTNLKRLKIELAMILAVYPFIAFSLAESADEDKKNKLLNLFAYVMLRTSFESGAPYNLVDVYKTLKTPTPLYSVLDNFGFVISYPLLTITSSIKNTTDINKKITRGAYKGKTKLEKNIILLLPIKNVLELNDIPSKRNYYQKQIAGD